MHQAYRILLAVLVVGLAMIPSSKGSWAQNVSLKDQFDQIQKALANNPNDPNLQMDLAYFYSEAQEIQKAIDIYENILKIDGKNQRAANELCVIQTRLQDQQNAWSSCARVTEIDANNPLAWDNLALSHYKLGDFAGAFRPFFKALALNRDRSLVLSHLGQNYLALGEYAVAEQVFHDLISGAQTNEERAYFYHGLYQALHGLQRNSEAYDAIYQTYTLSSNPLFIGKVISAFFAAHQILLLFGVSAVMLTASWYFGERLNRFLKNE